MGFVLIMLTKDIMKKNKMKKEFFFFLLFLFLGFLGFFLLTPASITPFCKAETTCFLTLLTTCLFSLVSPDTTFDRTSFAPLARAFIDCFPALDVTAFFATGSTIFLINLPALRRNPPIPPPLCRRAF